MIDDLLKRGRKCADRVAGIVFAFPKDDSRRGDVRALAATVTELCDEVDRLRKRCHLIEEYADHTATCRVEQTYDRERVRATCTCGLATTYAGVTSD